MLSDEDRLEVQKIADGQATRAFFLSFVFTLAVAWMIGRGLDQLWDRVDGYHPPVAEVTDGP